MTRPRIDITGHRFGKLTAISFYKKRNGENSMWKVKCDCGKIKIIQLSHLRNLGTKSCGCSKKFFLSKAATTHGLSKTKLYAIWCGIISRCSKINNPNYKNYGARGVHTSQKWHDFEIFLQDMGDSYFNGASIDRINNNGSYSKENCRWANKLQQSNNKRNNVFIKFRKKRLTIAEWSRVTGFSHATLTKRLKSNWSTKDILTKPIDISKRNAKTRG